MMILGVPWWVFLFIICIFISGYMSIRAMIAERKLEKYYIEREGKVYMDRIEEERTQKKSTQENKEVISS